MGLSPRLLSICSSKVYSLAGQRGHQHACSIEDFVACGEPMQISKWATDVTRMEDMAKL